MTTAPSNLLALRALVRSVTGLSAVATGITGDPAHRGGYHCGRDRVDLDDYSVDESSRDKAGLSDWACAFDEGWWEKRVAGKAHNLRSHSIWLVAQCKANTPDSRDIREIIYSPDGKTVKRWDRLGKRTTGDNSHLSHTHRSYFRDAIKAGRDQTALDRRYFTEIGLLAATTTATEPDMEQTEKLTAPTGNPMRHVADFLGDVQNLRNNLSLDPASPELIAPPHPNSLLAKLTTVPAKVEALATKIDTVVAKLNQPPDPISDPPTTELAITPEQLDELAAAVAARIQGPLLDALAARLAS